MYFPSSDVVEQGVQALLLWLRERDGTVPTIESDNTFFTAEAAIAPQLHTSSEADFAEERAAVSPPAVAVLPPIDPNPAPERIIVSKEANAVQPPPTPTCTGTHRATC